MKVVARHSVRPPRRRRSLRNSKARGHHAPPLPAPTLDRDIGGRGRGGRGTHLHRRAPRYFAPTKKTIFARGSEPTGASLPSATHHMADRVNIHHARCVPSALDQGSTRPLRMAYRTNAAVDDKLSFLIIAARRLSTVLRPI